jgi:uncharacterized membrane protein YcaP (DUF421 family)
MKKEDIDPGGWFRILFGEAPAGFLVEVLIRTVIMYTILIVIVRMMGKRMGGQVTISDLAVMITLGAIVSPGMQMPQTGLLLCTVILICALLFQRGINLLEYKSSRFEQLSQGKLSILVRDGVMQLREMSATKISRQQLFATLRNKEIYNLGDVERVYLESCGLFSIYKRREPAAGLAIYPPEDKPISSYSKHRLSDTLVCSHCGNVARHNPQGQQCPVCNTTNWAPASISVNANSESQS